jgi:RHS repeat-associated protein
MYDALPYTYDARGRVHKFSGKERDAESGLDYFGERYFSNGLGRFITPDEFWKDSRADVPQSWNKYAYARNNPLRFVIPIQQGRRLL